MAVDQTVTFILDGRAVTAEPGETIWTVARREGTRIPHLCHLDKPGYRPDGNCRACMVEIEGERTLAASCIRKPAQGMTVRTDTDRADAARRMVFEMLAADMPARDQSPDDRSAFWQWVETMGIGGSERLPSKFARSPLSPLVGEMSRKGQRGVDGVDDDHPP
ncbi:2Fe-2S iron-sulfur cluster-binding protein, partial [Roseitalea sp. MMSF_3546]